MKVAAPFAYCGRLATRDNISLMARRGEELGYDFVWMGEHIYYPNQMKAKYPYTKDGSLPVDPALNYFEIVSLFSFVAALTSKLRLHTSILMPAVRSPYLASKQLATLDYLSGGRLNLGLGLGWMTDEYDLVGVPWNKRGRYLDEWIVATRDYMAGKPFKGEFFQFEEQHFLPKPAQTPLPYWIGGDSDAAVERAARYGQGWQPVGPSDIGEKSVWLKERVKRIAEARAARGEGMEGFGVMTSCGYQGTEQGAQSFSDAKAETLDKIAALSEAGITSLILRFNELNATELGPVMDQAQWVSEEILPAVRSL